MLDSLVELDCGGNKFAALPPKLGTLTNLHELELGKSNIRMPPSEVQIAKARQRESVRERERDRARERVCVCNLPCSTVAQRIMFGLTNLVSRD